MTAPTKRTRGRPRKLTAVSIPAASTLGVRLTAEQRAALETAAGGLDLSTWLREVGLAKAGRSDLGAAGEAARLAEATKVVRHAYTDVTIKALDGSGRVLDTAIVRVPTDPGDPCDHADVVAVVERFGEAWSGARVSIRAAA